MATLLIKWSAICII